MARRVGFGDRRRETPQESDDDAATPERPDEAAVAERAAAKGPKKAGPVARLVIILFLLLWLALWSYGIHEAWSAASDLFEQSEWEAFDYAMLAFFAVWLTGALIGWAFGVVILVVMLFGKEVDRSPEEQAARWKRKLARRRSKDTA
jgi:hypothetical protein